MAIVNPETLVWARDEAGLTLDVAAVRLGLKDSSASTAAEKLLRYETGAKQPSTSLLTRISRLYRRPLLTFYLSDVPRSDEKVEDFRTLPPDQVVEDDRLVSVLVRDIKVRQSIVKAILIDEDEADPCPLVNVSSVGDSCVEVASKIVEIIGFDLERFRSAKDLTESFKYLRLLVENSGVFVVLMGNLGSHHTNISVSTFRGFALADDIAPFVVINELDAPAARSFTLLHELAHVCFGQTGLSGGGYEKDIERLCNNVASQVLLPQEDLERVSFDYSSLENLCDSIALAASERNISKRQIAYRLYLNGCISKSDWKSVDEYFEKVWLRIREQQKRKNREQGGGPNPYILKRYKLGSLVGLMKRMSSSGAVTATKAGKVLGTKPLKVHKLFDA